MDKGLKRTREMANVYTDGRKFELTDETIEYCGRTLYRIRALKWFKTEGRSIHAGEYGGFVESEANLSQRGGCWIYNEAKVFGEARVAGWARVRDFARVYNRAVVCGKALISMNARVYDDARIVDEARVQGFAKVHGNATVGGNVTVEDQVEVWGVCGLELRGIYRLMHDTKVTDVGPNATILDVNSSARSGFKAIGEKPGAKPGAKAIGV